MFEHGISAKWLRRAQWAICVFFGTFAFGGLWYVFHSAFERDIVGALIGAGVVWGSMGLGIGMHCVTQMAAVVDANLRALSEFQKRLDAMDQLVEELGPPMNLSDTGVGDPTALVAAHTESDAFPRLLAHAGNATGKDEPQEIAPEYLRESFREAIFRRDFARAIAIGEEITERWPDSAMADQFEQVRCAIERRLSGNGTERTNVATNF